MIYDIYWIYTNIYIRWASGPKACWIMSFGDFIEFYYLIICVSLIDVSGLRASCPRISGPRLLMCPQAPHFLNFHNLLTASTQHLLESNFSSNVCDLLNLLFYISMHLLSARSFHHIFKICLVPLLGVTFSYLMFISLKKKTICGPLQVHWAPKWHPKSPNFKKCCKCPASWSTPLAFLEPRVKR